MIAHTGYHPQVHPHAITDQNPVVGHTPDQPLATVMKTGADAADLGHNPTLTGIIAEATMTPTEAIPGHTTATADAITGVLPQCPHSNTYSHCSCCDTPHQRSSSHRSSLAYSRDHSRS